MSNPDAIRYDLIVQEAMLGVVKKVLQDTQHKGLKDNHHFYLTYSTCYEGVEIPSSLLEKYPDEITIVLQHEFENLTVKEDHFLVTLWFNNVPAHLRVPFKAIKAFFDPSVKFGLQFNIIPEDEEDEKIPAETDENNVTDIAQTVKDAKTKTKKLKKESKGQDDEKSPKADNVISLDSFRNK